MGVPLGFGVFLVRTKREYERTEMHANAAVAQRLGEEFDVGMEEGVGESVECAA